jgi:hypothetical protein
MIHGPSSNISFFKQVLQLKDNKEHTEPPGELLPSPEERGMPDLIGFTVNQPHNLAQNMDPVSLPDRQLSDALLQCFSHCIHPIFPILHWPSLTTMYDRLWQPALSVDCYYNRGRDDLVFHAILNMVLALGCQYIEHIPATQRSQFADSFYRRSQQLISVETLDFSSLQIVQLLLLRGLYLHYTNYADRCWNIIGVALRVAQGLGLHLEEAVAPKNQLNREMRRRVWHNCVALDR